MNLTLEERERAAYIAGDTALADLLGDKLDEVLEFQNDLEDANRDIERLQKEGEDLESELYEARNPD